MNTRSQFLRLEQQVFLSGYVTDVSVLQFDLIEETTVVVGGISHFPP